MADQEQQSQDTGNISNNYNLGVIGLNMDQTPNQIQKGSLTYALNAAVENFDSNSVNYQNEQGNDFCLKFPEGFVLIGKHFIPEKNKHIFFITNPDTGDSQIGYMDNNDCVYRILVSAPCLNFNIHYPIHKAVHKINKVSTEVYWTDGFNPRRYIDLDNIPYKLSPNADLCDPNYLDELDCNQIKVQPNFQIPQMKVVDIISGGSLTAGTIQFAIQYAGPTGDPYTSYYSITNPTPIANPSITSADFNYNVGKSVVVEITNLEASGQFQYFNLAVIKTVNGITSAELAGTYYIDNTTKTITYTGQQVDNINLSINDIFEKFPYFDIAQDVTAVQDILIWTDLTTIDRVNYQSIASQIKLQWESWRIPATENYADEVNATNLRGYMRDEVYAFEIVFLLKNGKETDGFHIPGRALSSYEKLLPNISVDNPDFIGEPTYESGGVGYSPYWKIYNTATAVGTDPAYKPDSDYKGPYQFGEFAYWESLETYPCNEELWGELAGQPIRHHKFPDVLVSPIYESKLFSSPNSMVMGNDAIFPIGVKIDNEQIEALISTSNLTAEQKADIVGYKIVRGDRGTNKSIIAKGILRNVGSYVRENQTYFYPNYPYNDLRSDPFLNAQNNAYKEESEPFEINIYKLPQNDELGPYIEVEYTDPNINKLTKIKYRKLGTERICSLTKPTILSPGVRNKIHYEGAYPVPDADNIATVNYRNYDIIEVKSVDPSFGDCCGGYEVSWLDYMSDGAPEKVYVNGCLGSGSRIRYLYTKAGTGFGCTRYCDRCGRRSRVVDTVRIKECAAETPVKPLTDDAGSAIRQIFNSPDTSFGQPFLGNVLKLENVMFGKGIAHFVQVKNNAKYKLLTKEAQEDALESSEALANYTDAFNVSAFFAAYQAYLEIYTKSVNRRNFAYSFNSIADYNYAANVPNGLGIKQRPIDIAKYLIPGVQSVGDIHNINNYQRESSVYIRTDKDKEALPFPSKTDSLLVDGNSIIEDKSRFTISGANLCSTPGKETSISVVSYYASIKNLFYSQWGQIYSYDTIDTGYQKLIGVNNTSTVFGGDTFIGRFAFKSKLPFFIDNRVDAPDDSDIFYDEIGNIAYPKYWHSARSILKDYTIDSVGPLPNIISYKAHEFDCPNAQEPKDNNPSRTYYDGYFYLFAYGIPNFYCESLYNLDLRQAFNNKEGDFFPHVSTSIPDDWLQQTFVPIVQDNTYYYNVTYSKQNKENTFTHLPADWKSLNYTLYPFRTIYSDSQDMSPDNKSNNWLVYRPLSYFDFPQTFGKFTSLDGIQNKAILARFENKTLMYNNLLTIDTSNPQAAYVGNSKMFENPPIDFADTDLGYIGSQNKFLLKIPQGQITVDAKRGQVFLLAGTESLDLSQYGSGLNRFFTDHLAFEILEYFPEVNTDNAYNGIGLHGVYDSKFDRVIITKLDYVPINKLIKYDAVNRTFYIDKPVGNTTIREEVSLTDTEMFCNKSWTLSYAVNNKAWVSFHSYIPNWYIAENNFFYSGINNDYEDFAAIAGIPVPIPSTTTTTTNFIPPITTTTTTTAQPDCTIEGYFDVKLCDLEGTAIITVPPIPAPCTRPDGLSTVSLWAGYQIIVPSETVDSTGSYEDAEAAASYIASIDSYSNIIPTLINIQYSTLEVGQSVYLDNGTNDCETIPNGWYFTEQSAGIGVVYYIHNGIISQIGLPTTTTTTTLVGDNLEFRFINILGRPSNVYINKNNYEGGPYLPLSEGGVVNGTLETGDTFAGVFKNDSSTQIRQVRYKYESSLRGVLYDVTVFVNVNVGVSTAPFTKVDTEKITITLEVLN